MSIDTNPSKNWNPYRALAVTGVWLALVVLVAVVIGNGCGETPPAPTSGSISLAWSITDPGGKPFRCAQVGARSVALRLRDRASGHVVPTAFPCEVTPGTAQVASGVYDVSIALLATDGATLATAPDQTRVAIAAGQVKHLLPVTFVVNRLGSAVRSPAIPVAANCRPTDGATLATAPDQTRVAIAAGQVKHLLPVTFVVNRLGSAVFSPAMPVAVNCRPVQAGGAGITGTITTLERSGSDAAAVALVGLLGSMLRGTHTFSCSSPLVRCVEETEILTTSAGPGSYLIHVRGKPDVIDGGQRDNALVVPPPETPLIDTVGLIRQSLAGC